MDKKWWHKSVVYQIYPRSFKDTSGNGIGDLKGIIEKLDYLENLGVDIIWLSPVYQSPMDDNGYDISDYRAIDPLFGSIADMDQLILEGEKRNIGIMMDLVVNHTSDDHPWFIESKSSTDSPKRDWYYWKKGKEDGSPPNNWSAYFARSAWELDEKSGEYYLHLFSKKQPDLNWNNPQVRQAVYEMMQFWLKKGIVGFRMDTINMIGKPDDFPDAALAGGVLGNEHWGNHSKAHQYLREMYKEVLSHYDVVTVGETPFVLPKDGMMYSHPARNELSMIFQFEHMDVDNQGMFSGKEPLVLTKLKGIMTKWQEELYGNGWNSLYWSNHDQARAVSRFGDDGQYRLESAKMLGAILHMMSGTPYIYQGEEVGLINTYYDDISSYNDLMDHNRYDVMTKDMGKTKEEAMAIIRPLSRDNARVPMSWTDEKNAGFSDMEPWLKIDDSYKSINVQKALEDDNSIFYFYKKLIQLRKYSEYSDVITYGQHELHDEKDQDIYKFRRFDDTYSLIIIGNFSSEAQYRSYDERMAKIVISNYSRETLDLSDLTLEPYEVLVIEEKRGLD